MPIDSVGFRFFWHRGGDDSAPPGRGPSAISLTFIRSLSRYKRFK